MIAESILLAQLMMADEVSAARRAQYYFRVQRKNKRTKQPSPPPIDQGPRVVRTIVFCSDAPCPSFEDRWLTLPVEWRGSR